MTAHHSTRESVIRELDSDQSRGLGSEQIAEKRSRFGENKLREKKKKSYLQRFIDQFKDVMILILLAAAAVSFVIACLECDPGEFFEPVLKISKRCTGGNKFSFDFSVSVNVSQ